MRWPNLRWLAILLVLLFLQEDWVVADEDPNNDDMMKELYKIHKLFTAIGRPRFRRDRTPTEYYPRITQRAALRLHELNRLYVDDGRPRYGKRTSQSEDYVPTDYESQYQSESNMEDWLTLQR